MPPETGLTQADAAAQANAEASRRPAETQYAGRVAKPDAADFAVRTRGYIHLRENMQAEMRGKYQDPEVAMNRLEHLDDAGRDRLRTNPEEIGRLSHNTQPSDINSGMLADGSQSLGMADKETIKDVERYDRQMSAYDASRSGQGNEPKDISEQMNQSLTNAPSLIHHLSI